MNSTELSNASKDPAPSQTPSVQSKLQDPAFPTLHARPRRGWLNDPNGICHRDGRWHVFFQHNPESARHNAIGWGHLSSADLLHWREETLALRPQPGGPDAFGCWSGVMADDGGVPTAVYSGVTDDSGRSQVTLARGSDDMTLWSQKGETAAGMPDDPSITAVRDPFLFYYAGRRFALQGAGLGGGKGAILLYDADKLDDWSYLGIWLTTDHPVAARHADAEIWECPQLAQINGHWVLIVSLWKRADDSHHHLSGVAHLVGMMDDVDGQPVFTPASGSSTDTGPDFYAPQVVALADRVMLWGWSWENRPLEESDAAGWAGLLTFPRELTVEDGLLVVAPARELVGYRRAELATGQVVDLPGAAEVVVEPHAPVQLLLQLASSAGTRTVHSMQSKSGIRLFVDGSIVEVYSAGSTATTLRAYPSQDEHWVLKVDGDARIRAWRLGPAPGLEGQS